MTQHKHYRCEWPLAQKLALPKKDITCGTGMWCPHSKEKANCWMSASLSGGKDTDILTVSQHKGKKQKVWVRQMSDSEKLIGNQRCTSRECKNKPALPPACSDWTRTKISSKYIIWKPLYQHMKKIGLVRIVKTLWDMAYPKGKTYHWYGIFCQTNHKKWWKMIL